jgi:hypothetical protein
MDGSILFNTFDAAFFRRMFFGMSPPKELESESLSQLNKNLSRFRKIYRIPFGKAALM